MREVNIVNFENLCWTVGACCLLICATILFTNLSSISANKIKDLTEKGYEQVIAPGSSAPIWQKIDRGEGTRLVPIET